MSEVFFSSKQKALAVVPKCTGFLSLLGSLFVIYDILRCDKSGESSSRGTGVSRKNKHYSIFHRIMLGLSVFDCMASIVNILSTWPTPSDQDDVVYGARGTTATCTAQGFFNEFGNITTPLYSASLSIWYLLYLKYGWREKECEGVEHVFHVIPIVVGFTMAVVGLPFILYNNSGFLCWYAPYPAGCDKTDPHTCTRGEFAGIFRWIHYGIVWTCIGVVTYSMISIYMAVRLQEKVSAKWRLSNTARRRSRDVAVQALLYVCALYLTWGFTTATRISQTAFKHNSYELLILMATFFPLQGFWNALIYFRPRYQAERRSQELKASMEMKRSRNSSKEEDSPEMQEDEVPQPETTESDTKPVELWKQVRMRQLERAKAAVKQAEEDEKKRLLRERELQMTSDEVSQLDEESGEDNNT